jgi:hypothetical protein
MIVKKQAPFIHLGTGGEVVRTFLIPIPPHARVIQYSFWIAGAGNALSNSLQLVVHNKEIPLVGVNIGAAIFNSLVTNSGSGTVSAIARATHALWTVRSNAVTDNDFFLNIGWGDV